jgi:putative SOS response-associated peptidase YedK
MCGRFTLTTPAEEWSALFEVDALEAEPRYNVAPTEDVIVVRSGPQRGGREALRMRWGLIPSWVEAIDDVPLLINARCETITEKPSFKDSFRERRCLVLADGFYEWRADAGGKRPYWIHLASGAPFGFAAIWDRWEGEDGPIESCAILTTDATDDIAPIHDRMPGILDHHQVKRWLDPRAGPSELGSLVGSPEPGRLALREVSSRVNSVKFDDPECLAPVGTQVDLFS